MNEHRLSDHAWCRHKGVHDALPFTSRPHSRKKLGSFYDKLGKAYTSS